MIRPVQLFPAAVLASFSSSLLVCALAASDGEWNDQRLGIVTVAVATALAMWVVGTGILAVAARHGVRRAHCLLLGAALAFLAPPATLFAAVTFASSLVPWLVEEFTGFQVVYTVTAALLNISFGCLGGWIVWVLGFPHGARADVDDGRTTRERRSLGTRRVLVSLCLLPLLPAVLITAILNFYAHYSYSDLWLKEIWWQLTGWVVLPAWVLAICCGMALVTAAPSKGRISRFGCLVLGGAVAFLLPLAFALTGALLGAFVPAVMIFNRDLFQQVPVLENAVVLYIAGAFVLPFGLPGGWLFWRFGVRPAPIPAPDVTGVFD